MRTEEILDIEIFSYKNDVFLILFTKTIIEMY